VNVEELSPLLRATLETHMYDQRAVTYLAVSTIVTAIFDAARRISGSDGGDNTKKALASLRKRLLPELVEDVERSAKDIEAMLKKEASGGPMKIRRLDYETGRKGRKMVR